MNAEQQQAEIQNIIEDALKLAASLGATQAEASMTKVAGISVSTRLKEVETLEYTNDGALGITVYKGKRKGSASTADLSHAALQETVKKAVEIARYTGEDDCSGLAPRELMAFNPPDLQLYHPGELDPELAIHQSVQAEEVALGADPRIVNSDGASYNANLGMRVYGNSHGLNVGYPSSRYSLSCVVIGQQGDDMQRDYSYTVARKAGDLKSPQQVGQEAAQHTVERLGAQKLTTRKCPVIFHHDIAGGLWGHLVGAISGGSLYRKSSFLLDHLGKSILPNWLNIEERPHLIGALASSAFDGEGVITNDMDIVTNGVLNHYLLTNYSAKKLGMVTNGHAGGIHNWLISHSEQSLAQLLKSMGTGLLVTELMGQGVNIVTGDYSRGAAGFWVENGEIQYPVSEITIAANLKDMFANIVAVGNDIDDRGSVHTGSVMLQEMQIAGV
ncbi:metalloprotease PmbA [Neptunicella marina]|uniref:Metalloprotease PmbA n=1 Tax=Neptunicella marina TaxID=2125989 RepID=A0A8J6IUG2_9ALTE|nr:metalloprotease PmbA [Neptunicella marina]MBC3766127.1 metalloprotease PmbA [Neptunicella marina]